MFHFCSPRRFFAIGGSFTLLLGGWLLLSATCPQLGAAQIFGLGCNKCNTSGHCGGRDGCGGACVPTGEDIGGSWFWMRSPEQERAVISGYFNRYCIRCHGIDGRGTWDIPGVPDFTNPRWQAYRSDGQIARI